MVEQHLRGCALLVLVVTVAVIAFIGGRLSVSGPGGGSPGGAVPPAPTAFPAMVAPPTGAVATATPTPRAIVLSPAAIPATSSTASPAASLAEATTRPADPSPTRRPARRREATTTPAATETPRPPRPRSRSAPGSPTAAPNRAGCDPSYPTVCIPPPPPVRDCSVTDERNFPVLPPDRHRLDSDNDGIGCEPIR